MIRKIIQSKNHIEWDGYLRRALDRKIDLHFTNRYHQLFSNKETNDYEAFIVEEDDRLFFYPYFKKVIPEKYYGRIIKSRVYDISSVFGYTGPVTNTNNENFFKMAYEEFKLYCLESNIIAELIRFNPHLKNHRFFIGYEKVGPIPLKDYIYIDLNRSKNDILNGYKKRMQEYIKSASVFSSVVEITSCNLDIFIKFCDLYKKHMSVIGASDYYKFNDEYFRKLHKLIENDGFLIYIMEGSKMIAGLIFLHDEKMGFYHHGARDINVSESSLINKYLFHRAFIKLKEIGVNRCLLGGGISESSTDRLLQFKNNYSNITEKFFLGKRVFDQSKYEEICNNWRKLYPDLVHKYDSFIDKYRFET
ncbi:MAG: hypothetical protein KF816_10070 [Melioribacteraceae bacterium]|nr:hypothetical protein [Melioribacteraceae bacterium]